MPSVEQTMAELLLRLAQGSEFEQHVSVWAWRGVFDVPAMKGIRVEPATMKWVKAIYPLTDGPNSYYEKRSQELRNKLARH